MAAPHTLANRAPGTDQAAEKTDGYHLIVDVLKLNGVSTIYGLVGIPITDLARLAQASGIRFLGFRHESAAGHAAAAAGFLTRKPGVCLTVSGPGFLNGLVALANATTNRFPMIQIAGSSDRSIIDLERGDYEELDQFAVAKTLVKAAYRVDRAQDIGLVLVGARLNWLLSHGEAPHWNPDAVFIQVDIDPTELDSNQPISAPLVGDIGSVIDALNRHDGAARIDAPKPWREALAAKSADNAAKMAARLTAPADATGPMGFYPALRAVRDVLAEHRDVYLVNEGANTLDYTRNVIDMHLPRHRLDCGTWGVMGIGLGYAIAAAVETDQPVVAVEGDSAFGFSGVEMETICRYHLPITVVVFNNGGIYRGDGTNPASADPSPTTLLRSTRYDRLIESFGGTGHLVTTPAELATALSGAIASRKPTLIDCVIDPSDGTESGHLTSLNPVGLEKH